MNIKNKVMTAPKEDSNGWDLAHLVGQLIDHRWIIVAVTAFFMLMATLYTLFATPIYSADAMVQVEQKNTASVLNELQDVIPTTPASDTEIQIIESRMVIGQTVNDLGLDTVIQQNYFPVIGKGLSRLMRNKPAQIAISRLEIPRSIDKRTVELEVTGPQTYTVSKDGDELFKGRVGQLEQHGDVTMLVSGIQADEGTSFSVTKLSDLQAIKTVLGALTVADKGKTTGVLGLEFQDEDQDQASRVLNQIVNNYLLQNVERKSEQAEKSLEFLRTQLPNVRAKLDDVEDKLNTFRRQNESVDMSLEAKSALDSSVSVQSQLNELTFREAEVSQLFTKDHPTYRALLEKRKTLEAEQAQLNKKISAMPQTQQEILRLTRDVQAGQEIYMQLLNRQQELGISKASTVGDVRIIDRAETSTSSVAPKKLLIIVAGLIVGLVLLKALFHHGIDNPEQLEELGMNVYASVPLSEWQRKKDTEALARRGSKEKSDPHNTLLALGNPTDLSIEAIRSLRTSLHFAMMEAKNNILMITGASPGIGNTFICANLATLVSKAGQRVLFMDGDMRRG
ncbi:capsular exopolysaccharide family [Plautia stali symbiont]|nr:capsular exopolysaccharide family [Plautia stali symbiont]